MKVQNILPLIGVESSLICIFSTPEQRYKSNCNLYKYDGMASVFVVQFNGFMSLTSYFDVKYRY